MARRVMVTVDQALAAQRHARLAARALLTARLHELPTDGLLFEACWLGPQVALDELVSLALTAVRFAAVALDASEVDVLAALLVGRTAVELDVTGPPP